MEIGTAVVSKSNVIPLANSRTYTTRAKIPNTTHNRSLTSRLRISRKEAVESMPTASRIRIKSKSMLAIIGTQLTIASCLILFYKDA